MFYITLSYYFIFWNFPAHISHYWTTFRNLCCSQNSKHSQSDQVRLYTYRTHDALIKWFLSSKSYIRSMHPTTCMMRAAYIIPSVLFWIGLWCESCKPKAQNHKKTMKLTDPTKTKVKVSKISNCYYI